MKPYALLLCLLLALSANFFTTAKAQVNVNDSLALVDLFKSTNGPAWNRHTNWLTKKPVSTWIGINVSDNRVTQIILSFNNMSGHIPASIGNCINLTLLWLY